MVNPKVLTEPRHPGEFILSEAAGSRSRESVVMGPSLDLPAGTVIGGPIAATTDVPAHYVAYDQDNSPTGSNVEAGILIYPVKTAADETLEVAIIARDAEVNGNMLEWPDDIEAGEQTTSIAALADLGIIVRL